MNKKTILFFVGLLVALILVSMVLAVVQVGLPWANNITNSRVGFGGGVSSGSMVNSKMIQTDQAVVSPMAVPNGATTPSLAPNPGVPRQVTKTGNLSILVATAETTVQNIQSIAESTEGYVSDSNLYEVTPGVKAGSITIRVPADKFDETMVKIKALAIRVENENVNSNDVTDQFIDLEARLKNLKTEEAQYVAILKKAQKIEDIVNVTNQLNQVQQQIDSWQGQLKYLNSQIDLSTITVNLTAEPDAQIFGVTWRPLTVARQAVRSLLAGVINYLNIIIAIVIFLPVIILWVVTALIIIWLIWKLAKLLRRKTQARSQTKSDLKTNSEPKTKTKKPTA